MSISLSGTGRDLKLENIHAKVVFDVDDHGAIDYLYISGLPRVAFDALQGSDCHNEDAERWSKRLRKGRPLIIATTHEPPIAPRPPACGDLTLGEAVAVAEDQVREGFDVHLERDAEGARFVSTTAGVSR